MTGRFLAKLIRKERPWMHVWKDVFQGIGEHAYILFISAL